MHREALQSAPLSRPHGGLHVACNTRDFYLTLCLELIDFYPYWLTRLAPPPPLHVPRLLVGMGLCLESGVPSPKTCAQTMTVGKLLLTVESTARYGAHYLDSGLRGRIERH